VPITKAEDLKNAKMQSQAMEKAKLSLRLATEKAVKENPGYQAVEITPELENGRPVATVTLIRGQEFKEVTQTLDLEETRADNKGNDFITAEESEWDPWEPFNEKTFWFNRQLDRYLLKPVATAYKAVLPDPVRKGLANALDNLDVTRRLVNNILQLRFDGAVREIARFVINSTVGMAGLFDVADKGFDLERSDRDTGQTLGKYGIAPGPYLVLPFLPPLTVRDLFGFVADEAMFPLDRFIPLGPAIGLHATEKISERAENIEEFAGVEETVVDLYGAVRNAYLQRRAADLRR
jgi:phospholipid-binding lipoprotein MlaA